MRAKTEKGKKKKKTNNKKKTLWEMLEICALQINVLFNVLELEVTTMSAAARFLCLGST